MPRRQAATRKPDPVTRKLLAVPAAIAAVLAVAGVAHAHSFDIGATCETGLHVTLAHYAGPGDSVTVWIDGHRVTDTPFEHTYTLHLDFDRTAAHTWRVKVDALPEKSPDRHGTADACVTATTTTVSASTTTTTVEATTTTVVAVGPPSVRPPAPLPATGLSGRTALVDLAIGTVLGILGGAAVIIARKRLA